MAKLFETQRKLDKRIVETHHLQGQSFVSEKVLALLVELGELANETRCFKFWSFKGPSDRPVILEEYVDGLHFILSVGLDLNYETVELDPQTGSETTLSNCFLNVFSTINKFNQDTSVQNYKDVFETFLVLGYQLGFSNEDIVQAYARKNVINHERQEQGY
ncbi:MAG TPA: dUTP diphosphatase [Sporolactobacillaceae bacterium]|nr:dUTP diphosphatase [Sporolactobacillaceae bacterium]